jgi:hypothetical protein
MYCRNEPNVVTVTLLFQKDGHSLPTAEQASRNDKGELQVQRSYRCGERSEALPFEVSLSSAAVSKDDHKLKARALISSNGNLLEESQEFDVHVPKGVTNSSGAVFVASNSQSAPSSRVDSVALPSSEMVSARKPAALSDTTQQAKAVISIPVVPKPPLEMPVEFSSDPAGASIEIDGKYVGKTPTVLTVPLGEHVVVVRKPEFGAWSRTINVTSASSRVAAYLEQQTLTFK